MKTKQLVTIGLMAAIGIVLSFLEFPLPIFPSFLKFDFSLLPAILAGLVFTPLVGILVTLIINLIHLLATQTGGIGELANFLVSAGFILVSGYTYRANKTRKQAIFALFCGIIAMTIVGALANYYILFPFYEKIIPISVIIKTVNGSSIWDVILIGIIPFNLFKGVILSIITYFVYKKISHLVK